MKSANRQTLIFIGIALALVGAVLIIYAISLPRVYIAPPAESVPSATVSELPSDNGVTDVSVSVKYPLDINTATAEELASVEGIGYARANAIIEYREYLGAYTSLEQLKDIEGFGDTLYAQILPYLTVK